jgi:hypothetical protein
MPSDVHAIHYGENVLPSVRCRPWCGADTPSISHIHLPTLHEEAPDCGISDATLQGKQRRSGVPYLGRHPKHLLMRLLSRGVPHPKYPFRGLLSWRFYPLVQVGLQRYCMATAPCEPQSI